ncbi:hypothetical protein ACO2Q0_21080 [Phenylobacterium sp. VNQ135]|uniref:hypothetical protein n=1 Tax=Phenylobacterium sp. VNQ135 TaxID=3400922 RepID=UPI003C10DF9C
MRKFVVAVAALVAGLTGSLAVAQSPSDAGVPVLHPVVFKGRVGEYSRLGPVGGYYPERASQAGRNGAAVIECRVGPARELLDCVRVEARPLDWGFDEAAIRMAAAKYIVASQDAADLPARAHFLIVFELPRRRLR